MADLEIDADQSNAGDGSHLQQPEDPAPPGQSVSFESIAASLQSLQLQTQERFAWLQKKNDELVERLKKEIEEKEIWMTRGHRMESRLAVATGGGDGDFADPTGGEKQLEILLQDIEFYKRENEALKKQLAASKGVNGTMDRQMGELDHPDSGPVEDAEPSQSTQATADEEPTQSTQPADDSRSEFTLDASPIPGVPQNTAQEDTNPHRELPRRTPSLSDRRDIQIDNLPMPGAPGYDQRGPYNGAASNCMDPVDAGDKAPDEEMLQFLASKVKHTQYKGLLRTVGLSDNKLDDVEHRYPRNPEECRFQSFQEWKLTLGVLRGGTLRKLVHGLIDSDIRGTAESFCEKFGLTHLVLEYDQMHPEPLEEPGTPLSPDVQEEDIPAEEEREKEPLEKVIGTLMHDPSSYETDLKLFLEEGNENFSMQQIEDFIKDQKWRNESKLLFKQQLELLHNDPTVFNILTSWAVTILSIYDSNQHRYTKIDKRKHVWRMMQSLRRSHLEVFHKFVQDKIFPGGVLGLNPETARKMVNQLNFNHHNSMKLLLQQTNENGNDWRGLAGKIPNVTQGIVNSWVQKGHDVGAENTLKTYGTSSKGTVQKLYEDLIDIERCDAAKVLED